MQQQQRAARFDLSFPLRFVVDSTEIAGHCLNLSESGLLAVFDEPLDLWTTGALHVEYGGQQCVVQARVARAGAYEAGLVFVYAGKSDHGCVQHLLGFAAQHSRLVGPAPF